MNEHLNASSQVSMCRIIVCINLWIVLVYLRTLEGTHKGDNSNNSDNGNGPMQLDQKKEKNVDSCDIADIRWIGQDNVSIMSFECSWINYINARRVGLIIETYILSKRNSLFGSSGSLWPSKTLSTWFTWSSMQLAIWRERMKERKGRLPLNQSH